jgi:hypothetical protein
MKLKKLILLIVSVFVVINLEAQQRRPIDSRHPLWLVHIDIWNQADPQKIIDLIPEDIRPYVCMNLSLSCSYDTKKNVFMRPQNAILTYKSWASVCQKNGLWFTCQPASGGHTHIPDNQLDTFEYFFKNYPNFLGWNYAEQFWGFDEGYKDRSSSSQEERLALFANLIEMSHRYGGFLTVSFCGNIWSHALTPVGMLKRNADLLEASRKYPEAILWLYKYTTSSCFYSSESMCFSPFVSGLAKNYGVRYDNCGWNEGMRELLGEDSNRKYPTAAGIGTIMEQCGVNGACVWDGPELIWTEDFQNLNNSTVDGYNRRNWGTFPGFRNIWIDMFRKIIDGTLYIPTREEVVEKQKIVVINDLTSGSDEDKYVGWGNLYDGLYKLNDPMNRNDGQYMNNLTYFKGSGRYGAIPVCVELTDNLAKSIPLQVKKSERNIKWPTVDDKVSDFNRLYPEVSTGDLYVNRYRNQLITYNPYSTQNGKKTATADIPLKYNSCEKLKLVYNRYSAGVLREYVDHLDLYLNNYRTDSVTPVKDEIVVYGATTKPSTVMNKRVEAQATTVEDWDATSGKYTITVTHNGPVDITITCSGTATDRETDYLPAAALDVDIPKQAQVVNDSLIIEAEDMDYRGISNCVVLPYYEKPDVRGHSGNGFMVMGKGANGSLRHVFNAPKAGEYVVSMRYMNNYKKGNVRFTVGNQSKLVGCQLAKNNEWTTSKLVMNMQQGANTLIIDNTSAIDLLVDLIVYREAKTADSDDMAFDQEYDPIEPEEPTEPEPTITPDNNIIYQDDFAELGEDYVPTDWTVINSNSVVAGGRAGSGPRVFQFAEGSDFRFGLYVRTIAPGDGYDMYGRVSGHELNLQQGVPYTLSCDAAAWKGEPWLKVEVLDDNDRVIASSIKACTPNMNGSRVVFNGATHFVLNFTPEKSGVYALKFTPVANENGAEGSWLEIMFGNVKLTKSTSTTAIKHVVADDINVPMYNLNGQRVDKYYKGIVIVNGKKVIRR